ncbi:aldolase/citrate lyase family protein (plasmid) [Natrinema zhouii]|uniref:HpcH/HpaI aldolase family protein n=1 Tax=Natrinema zhouii TaxID=1710539 RepID=UPI001CFF5517|nr:aldolase/citrate lyase family protein [Natrinema zhouii]UHQ98858.1 aldolase/citrate lyase family protein [Natrinema zhouii]
MVRQNTVREVITDDGVVLGARASSFSPALVEIYGDIGLDFVWLDFEHSGFSPWDADKITHLQRAAELSGIQLLVRLPDEDPALIRKVLDTGVRNLLIPRIETAAEVRRAAEATRFVYEGRPGNRGMAGQRASGYGTTEGYAQREDDTVNLGAMIETEEAVDNISDILDVAELGFAFVGSNDLATQLGHPNESDHLEVTAAIETVEAASRSAGVPLGAVAHAVDNVNRKISNGYQILRIGGEFESARRTLMDRMAQIE